MEIVNDSPIIFYTKCSDGNLGFTEKADRKLVLANRLRLSDGVGIPLSKWIFMNQVHGAHVAVVEGADSGKGIDNPDTSLKATDGMVTNATDIVLASQGADCTLVALWENDMGVIGIAHSGWKGTIQNIVGKTITKMMEMGAISQNIHAFLSPAGHSCCYKIGDDVAKEFIDTYAGSIQYVSGSCYLDLQKAIQSQIIVSGVSIENIQIDGHCTICSNDFYSYRREKERAGRMILGISNNFNLNLRKR